MGMGMAVAVLMRVLVRWFVLVSLVPVSTVIVLRHPDHLTSVAGMSAYAD